MASAARSCSRLCRVAPLVGLGGTDGRLFFVAGPSTSLLQHREQAEGFVGNRSGSAPPTVRCSVAALGKRSKGAPMGRGRCEKTRLRQLPVNKGACGAGWGIRPSNRTMSAGHRRAESRHAPILAPGLNRWPA